MDYVLLAIGIYLTLDLINSSEIRRRNYIIHEKEKDIAHLRKENEELKAQLEEWEALSEGATEEDGKLLCMVKELQKHVEELQIENNNCATMLGTLFTMAGIASMVVSIIIWISHIRSSPLLR